MFGLAYVILPFTDRSPAEAITQSLARFQRGRQGDLPEEWLRFHDDTADLRTAYETPHTFTCENALRRDGGSDWLLSTVAIMTAMKERGRDVWTVCFADIEPDFAAFVERYCAFSCERHPVTGGFGRWLNDLGQWDWWELGGCFNGAITGHERGNGIPRTAISSGYSEGRQAFEMLAGALADACGDEPPDEIDIVSEVGTHVVGRGRDLLNCGGHKHLFSPLTDWLSCRVLYVCSPANRGPKFRMAAAKGWCSARWPAPAEPPVVAPNWSSRDRSRSAGSWPGS